MHAAQCRMVTAITTSARLHRQEQLPHWLQELPLWLWTSNQSLRGGITEGDEDFTAHEEDEDGEDGEEVVEVTEEQLMQELDRQEPAFHVCSMSPLSNICNTRLSAPECKWESRHCFASLRLLSALPLPSGRAERLNQNLSQLSRSCFLAAYCECSRGLGLA